MIKCIFVQGWHYAFFKVVRREKMIWIFGLFELEFFIIPEEFIYFV